MSQDRYIEKIEDVDVNSLKPQDIAILGSGGNGTAHGRGEERVVVCRTGFITRIGNINSEIWDDLADAVILAQPEEAGEPEILEAMDNYIAIHGRKYLRERPKERHHEALLNVCGRKHEDPSWADFVPFNTFLGEKGKKRLADADLQDVIMFCCGKRATVSGKALQAARDRTPNRPTISCPLCGKNGMWMSAKR